MLQQGNVLVEDKFYFEKQLKVNQVINCLYCAGIHMGICARQQGNEQMECLESLLETWKSGCMER
jgi:hypothetical protein